MQADWEFEIGGDAPVIDACWDGFVDLRANTEAVSHLPEAAALPGLEHALTSLNSTGSQVWTAKCDVWVPEREEWAESGLEESVNEPAHARACYIDLLTMDSASWAMPDDAAHFCKSLCNRLEELAAPHGRVDLVIRIARTAPDKYTHGITAYLIGAGSTESIARDALGDILGMFAVEVASLGMTSRAETATIEEPRASSSTG